MGVWTDELFIHILCCGFDLGVIGMIQRRFEVWDEDGKLRSFYTKAEAQGFLLPGMRLVVNPKIVTKKLESFSDLEALVGVARF